MHEAQSRLGGLVKSPRVEKYKDASFSFYNITVLPGPKAGATASGSMVRVLLFAILCAESGSPYRGPAWAEWRRPRARTWPNCEGLADRPRRKAGDAKVLHTLEGH